jgi:hypothetical protein
MICDECDGSGVIVEVIPGHAMSCFGGECDPEQCPEPYPMQLPCPKCHTEEYDNFFTLEIVVDENAAF